ncbi:MAG: glycosyltransferase family 4 protein [Bacteroidota bacterium]
MKLLFVLEHFHPYLGGAEHLFCELTKTLAGEGHTVTVVTTLHDKHLPGDEIVEGVQIIRINCLNRFGFTFLSLPKILRIASKYDMIQTSTYNAAIPAWIAGKLLNKPVILTFHEYWGELWMKLPFISFWQRKVFQLFERWIMCLRFSHYVAVSKFTQTRLEQSGIPGDRISMIYNGLNYAAFLYHKHQAPTEFKYTYFGRLGISKGLDILLPAAQLFYEKHPDSKLQLIVPRTPTSIYKKILKLIDALKLKDHIKIFHSLPKQQLYKVISESSCVVIPSYSEGFCFAAAEAIALGVPLVSSQKGALKEVVSGTYLPVEPLDVNSLFDALTKAANGEWQELPIRYFHFETTIEQYIKLYAAVLDKKRSS